MNLEQRILMSVSKRPGKVVLRQDVARLGSPSGVSLAIKSLVARGKLVRLGAGVYAKTRISSISGRPVADGRLEDLSAEALQRLGVEFDVSSALKEYNAGLTTQIPAQITFNTGRRRISRKMSLGVKSVQYEKQRTSCAR